MTRQERVFIVQDVSTARRIDLSDAYNYGEVIALLPEDKDKVYNTRDMQRVLETKLRDFSDKDYLLALGDPTVIGIACVAAAKANNYRWRMLRWDKDEFRYIPITIDMR